MTTRRRSTALITALGLIVSTLALAAAAPAQATSNASIVATPHVVINGLTISVRGNAGAAHAPDLYVAVCEDTPTASNCDTNLAGIGTPTAHFVQVSPNPKTGAWGPISFYLRQTLVTGHTPTPGFACATTCVIGTTDAFDPSVHTFDSTTPLTYLAPTSSPVLSSGPVVKGSPRVGAKVSCTAGYDAFASISYGWRRGGAAIAGAGAATYTPTAADLGKALSCTSRASNVNGTTSTSTSSAVTVGLGAALVSTKAPKLSGKAKVGKKLTVGTGSWSPAATSYKYQWLRDGKAIKKATKAKYKIVKKDKKHKLRCKVTAIRAGHSNGVAKSKVSTKVK